MNKWRLIFCKVHNGEKLYKIVNFETNKKLIIAGIDFYTTREAIYLLQEIRQGHI